VYRLHPGSLTTARARTLHDRVRMMEKARVHAALRPAERAWLERAIGVERGRAALADAQEAVATGQRDARRRCLAAARVRSNAPADRLRALTAAALPRSLRSIAFARGGSRPPLARG
jgi:hypothetical protein